MVEDYQLDDPVPQTLGPVGKLYLYTPLSTDEYGFPLSRDYYIANQRAFNPTATLIEGTPEYDFLIEIQKDGRD